MNFEAPLPLGGRPVHLTGTSTAINPSSDGGLNAQALRNPLGVPVEVHEIRFMLYAATASNSSTAGLITGSNVSVRFDYGRVPVVNDLIPISALCRAYDPMSEVGAPAFMAGIAASSPANYVWKLSQPMLLWPGQMLQPLIHVNGQVSSPITVQIGLAGRTANAVKAMPKTLRLPYAAAYTSKQFDVLGALDTDTSQERALANPFSVPLYVDRFVGRINLFPTSALNAAGGINLAALSNYEDNWAIYEFGCDLLQLTMFRSDGYPVVPTLTPFRNVFSNWTKSWECPHVLPPGGYYNAALTKNAPTNQTANTINGFAHIGMVGWHEIPTKSVFE